ncbi:glycerophosphodiester phosphodiesterase [Robertkochia aurantiaca]|uniref:glycerophosphodiester phosphodiesterase n=1 Tax=Robertkochia aurantiaca TaxID=2873700 RepID=UPI001CCE978B|nr:glycerophosphodiester phosphodiesterase family protein [Robertkochia sp. 3YJGBD-33]
MNKIFAGLLTIVLLISCTEMTKPLVVGHRGAMGYAPENTIASIERALDLGVDMIEIDVFKCSSGEIVVFHDEKLERLTNGEGYLEDKSFFMLRQLRVADEHQIPMLQDVLKAIDKKARLNIELKGDDTAEKVNHIVTYYVENNGWQLSDFVISSFKWDELRKLRELNPDIAIGVLTEEDPMGALEVAKELNAYSIHPDHSTLTAENVEAIKGEGFKVFTWTVNEQAEIERMKAYGVDGIISDYPDRVAEEVLMPAM